MDKKSVVGFLIIGIILIFWMVWTSKMQKPIEQKNPANQKNDTAQILNENIKPKSESEILTKDSLVDKFTLKYGKLFEKNSIEYLKNNPQDFNEKIIIIENDNFILEFTNFGGSLRKVIMKNFKTWDGHPVQLIDMNKGSELNLLFTSSEGILINTKSLVFNCNYNNWDKVFIEDNKKFTFTFTLNVNFDTTQRIIKNYTINKDNFEVIGKYEFINPQKFIADSKYQLVWSNSLNLTEYRSDEEATFSASYAYMGGELEELMPKDYGKEIKYDFNGNTDFVATRNKYFGVFIIPQSRKGDGVFLTGDKIKLPDEGQKNILSAAVKMDIKNDYNDNAEFKILITPIDYKILKSYNLELEKTMRFALDFLVRPIAQFFIIPFFTFLHEFIPNYGLVIIIFAIVLKILLNPLTKKQMDSMKKMGQLNPKMTAIREKYKDDPTKMNNAIMKLYKEEGINPMGGCLPMLLQLPILYALYGVFRSTIELRQAAFFGWIKDLSAPDVLFHLPFKIPLFGIDQISGLATLMGITMFIQQKMTVTDPKQKMMVYIMPIMLTLLFFSFPSGLNLYYFMFNLLSIGQQIYTTKFKPQEPENTKPPKESLMQKFIKKMQEQQKELRKRRK